VTNQRLLLRKDWKKINFNYLCCSSSSSSTVCSLPISMVDRLGKSKFDIQREKKQREIIHIYVNIYTYSFLCQLYFSTIRSDKTLLSVLSFTLDREHLVVIRDSVKHSLQRTKMSKGKKTVSL